ncbi:hypothetical protein [Acinetobacter sp. 197]|uniref:Bbp19 family protein n=1 Tax=Acinetobacter sp. 197 TaxID=3114696 RepID=UPI003A83EE5C
MKDLGNELFKERALSSTLRNEKHHEWERAEVLQGQVFALKQDIADLKAQPDQEFKELIQEQEDELGFGHHVKWRSHRKPTALTYQMHFDMDVNGQRILEELTVRFKRNAFTDNERETCRRLGRAEVVDFIINRINTANDPRYDESLELAHMEQNNE